MYREDAVRDADFSTQPCQPSGERVGHRCVIDDSGLGDPQTRDARGLRLTFSDLFARKSFELYSVRAAACLQRGQPWKLFFAYGNNELSTPAMRNVFLLTKPVHRAQPVSAQAGFQRSRFVVQPGMNDSAVMSGLVRGK